MREKQYSRLMHLATLVRPQLELPFETSNIPIDDDLVSYAIDRHRIGPILYKAIEQAGATDIPQHYLLEASYKKNAHAILAQQATSNNLATLFDSEAIPFSFLKGLGLARQLYVDTITRQSKDIDILIPNTATASALRLLAKHGYKHQPTTLRNRKAFSENRQISDMKRMKDQTFVDLKFSTAIELHQRLFKLEPDYLTSRFNEAIEFESYPSINNVFYCFYFVLHGALSLWPRLKWVADLSLLLRRMRRQDRTKLLHLSNEYGCEAAIVASLKLAENIFPGSLDDEWHNLLVNSRQPRLITKTADVFLETLSSHQPLNQRSVAKRPLVSDSSYLIFGKNIGVWRVIRSRILNSIAIRV